MRKPILLIEMEPVEQQHFNSLRESIEQIKADLVNDYYVLWSVNLPTGAGVKYSILSEHQSTAISNMDILDWELIKSNQIKLN